MQYQTMSVKRTPTLINNWVEERQCEEFERDKWNKDGTLCTRLHREGHKGILSTQTTADMETTFNVSYSPPKPCTVKVIGKRQEMLHRQLYELAKTQTDQETSPPKIEYTSVTKMDYTQDFIPAKNPPNMLHDLSEAPTSYWSQNVHQITGVSQICTKSPFHRNTAFSTPIEHYLDQQKPHE